jgi:hypothetical protein
MRRPDFLALVPRLTSKVIGASEEMHDGERLVAACVARAFDYGESTIMCQPSLAYGKSDPPDVVLVDPETGVDVFEVKGCELDAIVSINPGGEIAIRYGTRVRVKSPIHQAHRYLHAIRDALTASLLRTPKMRVAAWVVWPRITRKAWFDHFGQGAFCPDEFLFSDDLTTRTLRQKLGATDRDNQTDVPIPMQPVEELEAVLRAFGDTSVLKPDDVRRPPRVAQEHTLGWSIDREYEHLKYLSDEQQRLCEADWGDGPRLVRGVAGSGKTVVLATSFCRYLQRTTRAQQLLFPDAPHREPRVAAVCFNRTLAPLLKDRIAQAWRQRSDSPLPSGNIEVTSFNRLVFDLSIRGLWTYRKVSEADDRERSIDYLDALRKKQMLDPQTVEKNLFDAIFVDEGQDFLPEDFKLLLQLVRGGEASKGEHEAAKPNLFVFYDDAQNLYGRPRPNWMSLGLDVRGRATVMTKCFRNTKGVIEAATNVLYGTRAAKGTRKPSKEFADLTLMMQRGLVSQDTNELLRIRFAQRTGQKPQLHLFSGEDQELKAAAERVRSLIVDHKVRPQDVFVIAMKQQKVQQLVRLIEPMKLPGVTDIHLTFQRKDELLGLPGRLTFSTIHSCKGHDAACVVLLSANEIMDSVEGRAMFYVACTRATHQLDVFAYRQTGLAGELQAVLEAGD